MAIQIEFLSSWRGISNTHRVGPYQGPTSHLWYNSGVTGLTDAASPRATLCQVIGTLTPLGLTPMSPSTSFHQDATYPSIPSLNCITRLCGQNGLSGQLSVRLRSTRLKDVQRISPETTQTGTASHPRHEVSCGCTIELPPSLNFILKHGSIHNSYTVTRDPLHLNLVDDRKSSDFYRTK
jgi:hypothetical protein